MCTVTSQVKGYPSEHRLPDDCVISGVVLVDHVKNQDWKQGNTEFVDSLASANVDPICDMIDSLIRQN
jgi:mRNA-degrading endonuclease toxin of MazEF toxin-antitoxin module